MDDEFKDLYISEAQKQIDIIDDCQDKLVGAFDKEVYTTYQRAFHTLKGNSLMMGFENIGNFSKLINDTVRDYIEVEKEVGADLCQLFRESRDLIVGAIDKIKNEGSDDTDYSSMMEKINSAK